jgi:hypothetical protein
LISTFNLSKNPGARGAFVIAIFYDSSPFRATVRPRQIELFVIFARMQVSANSEEPLLRVYSCRAGHKVPEGKE